MRQAFALVLFSFASALAAIPQSISYQGRVVAFGTNFSGIGQFKFALISGTNTAWTSDGSGLPEPLAATSLPVANGLLTVALGVGSNMPPISADIFQNGDVRLRVWFGTSTNTIQMLVPDQEIHSVGYAFIANNVPAGTIGSVQLADGAVTLSKLAAGVQFANAPSNTILLSTDSAAGNLISLGYSLFGRAPSSGSDWQTVFSTNTFLPAHYGSIVSIPNGMIVWGGSRGQTNVNTGAYYDVRINGWKTTATNGTPLPRRSHSAVWTGLEMLIWGGLGGYGFGENLVNLGSGGRYNLQSDSWFPITDMDAPSPRLEHAVVWTGSKMIVWGGYAYNIGFNTYRTDGGIYDPVEDRWQNVSVSNAPSTRRLPFVCWTGTEMIIWGGSTANQLPPLNSGSRYNPVTDVWSSMNTYGAPPRGGYDTAVWTGSELVTWDDTSMTGGRYNPTLDEWRTIRPGIGSGAIGSPPPVWYRDRMLFFGNTGFLSSSYSPDTDAWTSVASPPEQEFTFVTVNDSIFGFSPSIPHLLLKYEPQVPLWLYKR